MKSAGDTYRRTGRTTRMLRAALKDALDKNQVVLVIGWDERQARDLMKAMMQLPEMREVEVLGTNFTRRELRLVGNGVVKFRHTQTPDWDWHTSKLRAHSPLCPVHIDHYAHEQRAKQK